MDRSNSYKGWLLVVLAAILSFNYVDRLVLGLVLQEVKTDLHLSDTQLGFLTGLAFALFYSVMGIPIARWADRGNRVIVIATTTALWSVAVVGCGMVTTFIQLLMIRIAVAVGEAGCIPPAHSLITDYFTRAERPRALARYMFGASLSVVMGYFLAGWLNGALGWRVTFQLLGIPGIILAIIALLVLREPRNQKRNQVSPISQGPFEPHPELREVFRTLWKNFTFRHLLLCFSLQCFFGYGLLQWQPSFFIRSYGLTTRELGVWLTLTGGLGNLIGTYLGGEWAFRKAAHNEPRQFRTMAILYCGFAALSAATYLVSDKYSAFALMGLGILGINIGNGPLFATIQTLVPERMRAMSVAMVYLFANLIGMGLGPLAVGILSDALHPYLGPESLRYALMMLAPGYFLCAWHIWQASKTVTHDLALA